MPELKRQTAAGLRARTAGRWDEALAAYELALSLAVRAREAGEAVDILRRIGLVHRDRGDYELAMEAFETSIASAEAHGMTSRRAAALVCVAGVDQMCGRMDAAERVYHQVHELAAELGDAHLDAMVNQNLGVLANVRGDVGSALRHYERAVERYEAAGEQHAVASVLNNVGMARVDLGDWAEAERCFSRAASLAEEAADAMTLGSIEVNRAECYLKQGDFPRARECCERAGERFRRLGCDAGIAEAGKYLGVLYRETGEMERAHEELRGACELAHGANDQLLEAEILSEWALVQLARERNPEALHCLNRAHHLFARLHANRELHDLNGRLDDLERTYLRVVRSWAESIESKDRYTAGHCERVAGYACRLAEAVGFTGRDLVWFRMGGYLHDVGKIAVPAEVLNKPGKLDASERAAMRSHTTAGDAIVAELNFPWNVRPMVRSHHERWDGGGYPDGLHGEEIPLTARILCVADIYDALTTARSYRGALSHEKAISIMEGDVGRILDPSLFPVFRDLLESGEPEIEAPSLLPPQVIAA